MTLAAVLVLAAALGQEAGPAHAQEVARHQGTWLVERFEREGVVTPGDTLATIRRVVAGDHVAWSRDGKPFAGTRFEIDATAQPATIDLIPDGGPARDKRVLGIYRFEENTLTICTADPDRPRPTGFESPAGSGQTLMVFRRQAEAP